MTVNPLAFDALCVRPAYKRHRSREDDDVFPAYHHVVDERFEFADEIPYSLGGLVDALADDLRRFRVDEDTPVSTAVRITGELLQTRYKISLSQECGNMAVMMSAKQRLDPSVNERMAQAEGVHYRLAVAMVVVDEFSRRYAAHASFQREFIDHTIMAGYRGTIKARTAASDTLDDLSIAADSLLRHISEGGRRIADAVSAGAESLKEWATVDDDNGKAPEPADKQEKVTQPGPLHGAPAVLVDEMGDGEANSEGVNEASQDEVDKAIPEQ